MRTRSSAALMSRAAARQTRDGEVLFFCEKKTYVLLNCIHLNPLGDTLKRARLRHGTMVAGSVRQRAGWLWKRGLSQH